MSKALVTINYAELHCKGETNGGRVYSGNLPFFLKVYCYNLVPEHKQQVHSMSMDDWLLGHLKMIFFTYEILAQKMQEFIL